MSSSSRGLRFIKALEGYVKRKPNQYDTESIFAKAKLASASGSHARITFTVQSSMCNAMSTLHGGYIASIIDTAAICNLITAPKGKFGWTTNLNIVYINSASPGDQVTVETSPFNIGGTSVVTAKVTNDTTGSLMANGTVSLVFASDKLQKVAGEILQFDFFDDN